MAEPFVRIDLADNARDFRPKAIEPGLALLDPVGSTAKMLYRWFGPLLAEPEWRGNSVNFYVQDDSGNRLEDARPRPTTPARLNGALAGQLQSIREKIAEIRPSSNTEQTILHLIREMFESQVAQLDQPNIGAFFYEYRDVNKRWRLVWCWGYQAIPKQAARPMVCRNAECRQLFLSRDSKTKKCPTCFPTIYSLRPKEGDEELEQVEQEETKSGAGKWVLLGLLALLLLVAIGVGIWWLFSTGPTGRLDGLIACRTTGRPIADATVTATGYSGSPDASFPDEKPTVKTDAQGRFVFEELPLVAGQPSTTFRVHVEAAGYAPADFSPVVKLDSEETADTAEEAQPEQPSESETTSSTDETSTTEETAATEEAAKPETKLPPPMVRWELDGAASLNGRVLGGNIGLRDAIVRLQSFDYEKQLDVDPAGRFHLEKFPVGPIDLFVESPGYLPQSVTVDLVKGETKQDVKLVGATTLAGRVTDTSVRPIAGAEVRIPERSLQTTTDADGKYRFEELVGRDPPVTVSVEAEGFSPTQQTISLVGPEAACDFMMQVGMVGKLGGQLINATTRQPITGATVRLISPPPAPQTGQSIVTDDRGVYRFLSLMPGMRGRLSITADGYHPLDIPVTIQENGATVLNLPLRPLPAPTFGTLRGVVVSATTNQPVAGATVMSADSPTRVTTDALGRFTLDKVPTGSAKINVAAPGYRTESFDQHIVVGTASSLRAVITPTLRKGEIRVVLTWGPRPKDLDAHLLGPAADGSKWHVHFLNKTAPGVQLDVDAKEGYGPETITILQPVPGSEYEYYVLNYQELGVAGSKAYENVAAQVRLYYGNETEVYYPNPSQIGAWWNVFNLTIDAQGKPRVTKIDHYSVQQPAGVTTAP